MDGGHMRRYETKFYYDDIETEYGKVFSHAICDCDIRNERDHWTEDVVELFMKAFYLGDDRNDFVNKVKKYEREEVKIIDNQTLYRMLDGEIKSNDKLLYLLSSYFAIELCVHLISSDNTTRVIECNSLKGKHSSSTVFHIGWIYDGNKFFNYLKQDESVESVRLFLRSLEIDTTKVGGNVYLNNLTWQSVESPTTILERRVESYSKSKFTDTLRNFLKEHSSDYLEFLCCFFNFKFERYTSDGKKSSRASFISSVKPKNLPLQPTIFRYIEKKTGGEISYKFITTNFLLEKYSKEHNYSNVYQAFLDYIERKIITRSGDTNYMKSTIDFINKQYEEDNDHLYAISKACINLNTTVVILRKVENIKSFEILLSINMATDSDKYNTLYIISEPSGYYPIGWEDSKKMKLNKIVMNTPFNGVILSENNQSDPIIEFLEKPEDNKVSNLNISEFELSCDNPDYNIEYTGFDQKTGAFIIKITNNNNFPYSGNNTIFINRSDFKNFRHDFTFSGLVSGTDRSFKDLGLTLDDDDKLSPDFSYLRDGLWNVVEFTTTMSNNKNSQEKGVVNKNLKYSDSINKRAKFYNLKVRYDIISVSSSRVQCTFNIPQSTINELICRFKLSMAISNSIMSSGDYRKLINDMTKREADILQIFSDIKLKDVLLDEYVDTELLDQCERAKNIDDDKYVSDLLSQTVRESFNISDDSPVLKTLQEKVEEKWLTNKDHYMKIQDGYKTRSDMKAPVQLPFYSIGNSNENFIEEVKECLRHHKESTCAHLQLWASSFSQPSPESENDFISEVEKLGLPEEQAREVEEKQKRYKKVRGRHFCKLSRTNEVELANIGFKGKKCLENFEVKAYRDYTKQAFSLSNTYTDDIDEILDNASHLFVESGINDNRSESISTLLRTSGLIHESNDSSSLMDIVDEFVNTHAGNICRFLSDFATEATISLQQQCVANQVIIKKMKNYDCFLLLKPCGSNNKIFVSLFFEKNKDVEEINTLSDIMKSTVFKKINEIDKFYYTEMVSFSLDKLVNIIRAESMGLCLISFWCEFYSKSLSIMNIKETVKRDKRIPRMWLLTMCILLNDKHNLEELITMTRFIHAERMVSYPNIPEPSKMLKRINGKFRSRLEVWVSRCIFNLCQTYTHDIISNSAVSRDYRIWKCFRNPYDNCCFLENQDQMLSLCYIGYLKNKNSDPEKNSSGDMIDKIVGFEDKFPRKDGRRCRKYLGRENPEIGNVNKHEFSPSLIKVMCDDFLSDVKKVHAMDPKEKITSAIIRRLSYEYIDVFSTLKASSEFNESWYVYDKNKTYHRSKVITKVLNILNSKNDEDLTVLVIDLLKEALSELEKRDCMHICIFKKNQHGGLREIYVLEIDARIVQKCVEEISKAILEDLDFEIMTHPKNKFSIPEKHNTKAKSLYNNKYNTYSSSDDASKWSQGHYVTKFAIMLCSLTDSTFHGFIIRALRLWLRKRIKIPDDLLSIMFTNQNMKNENPILQELFNSFKGLKDSEWSEYMKTYLSIETGMMQGILHYTSSLYHSLFLKYYKKISLKILDNTMKKLDRSDNCIMDLLVSSDDSSVIISYPIIDNIQNNWIMMNTVNSVLSLKHNLGLYLGIYKSDKSTQFTQYFMEFNSEFCFFGDVHRPTFRWVNSCLLISEQENLMARQEELYNLCTNVVQGGGSFLLSHLCHLAQGLLHYRLLGSSVSDLWPIYSSMLSNDNDPAMGFFLVDHPLATGLAGLQFLLWKYCKRTSLGVKYKKMYLSEIDKNIGVDDDEVNLNRKIKMITLETTTLGLFNRATTVSFGSNTRWKHLMELFKTDELDLDEIDKNPEILYIKPRNVKELKQKLYLKMKSPGVISSLGKENALARIISSSVYLLSRPIIVSQSVYYNDLLQNKKKTLLSLMLRKRLSCTERIDFNSDNMVHKVDFKFPNFDSLIDYLLETSGICPDSLLGRSMISSIKYQNSLTDDEFLSVSSVLLIGIRTYEYQPLNGDYCYIKSMKEYSPRDSIRNIKIAIDDRGHLYTVGNYISSRAYLDSEFFTEEEENTLFPFNKDYITIQNIYDTITLSKSIQRVNQRRRKRCNIQMTGVYDRPKISIENVIMYFWFGRNTKHYDSNSFESLFNIYKSSIPWLSKDPVETLMKSPFDNQIQLQNFFSRLDKSSRSVNVVGSFTRSHNSNVQIASIIKKNFSNGIEFTDIYVDDSAQKMRANSTYSHFLSLLSMLPINVEYKNELVRDLILNGPEFDIDKSTNVRSHKIKIFRDFIKKCPLLRRDGYNPPLLKVYENKIKLELKESIETVSNSLNQMLANLDDLEKSIIVDEIEPDWFQELDEFTQSCYYYMMNESTVGVIDGVLKIMAENRVEELTEDEKRTISKFVNTEAMKLFEMNVIKEPLDYNMIVEEFQKDLVLIMEKLTISKLGVIGHYTKPQKYNSQTKRYEGEGIWEGKFSDVCVKIHITSTDQSDSELIRFEIDTSSCLDVTVGLLKQWCKENKVTNNETPFHFATFKTNVFAYINQFEVTTDDRHKYCPIILNKNLITIVDYSYNSFKIVLSTNSLRLKALYSIDNEVSNPNHNEVTLIQLPLGQNFVFTDLNKINSEDFPTIHKWPKWVLDWIMFRELNKNSLLLMNSWVNDQSKLVRQKIDTIAFKKWLEEIWRERINMRVSKPIAMKKMKEIVPNINLDIDSITLEMYHEFCNQASTVSFDEEFLKLIMGENLDLLEGDFEYIEQNPSKTVFKYHPYLMKFCDETDPKIISLNKDYSNTSLLITYDLEKFAEFYKLLFSKDSIKYVVSELEEDEEPCTFD